MDAMAAREPRPEAPAGPGQPDVVTAWAVPGIPEVEPGDDLAALVGDALAEDAGLHPDRAPRAGDILIVTSKVVSKAEGRVVAAENREQAITDETVRVVATRAYDGGITRIVENRLGIVGAAAGVDASNTREGTVLLLPENPDASARALLSALRSRFGVDLGVIVSDTLGRAWRLGQTDIVIGAAGVRVVDDLRGQTDSQGRTLAVTQPAVGDELAALGDLVKGKAGGLPVAVVRGASRLVIPAFPGEASAATTDAGSGDGSAAAALPPFATGRSLVRTGPGDMFRLGADEALAEGYRRGLVAGLALARAPEVPDDRRWTVVVPFKGGPDAKSRLAAQHGALALAAHVDRSRLALAFLRDTLGAVRVARGVGRVLVVSGAPRLAQHLDGLADVVVPDPGTGLNTAVAAGVAAAQAEDPATWTAVLVGDLPALTGDDLESALDAAVAAGRDGHPYAFVPDRDGTGTTVITVAPGAAVSSRFGAGSAALHRAAGYAELSLPAASTLRMDVDDPAALAATRDRFGPVSRDLLA
jgi:coenzyme F420-0:L-glutamate ligase/coenzyme F420-1:gamma-L-glutamate ligase